MSTTLWGELGDQEKTSDDGRFEELFTVFGAPIEAAAATAAVAVRFELWARWVQLHRPSKKRSS